MKNITVILPVHKFDDDYKVMIGNAVSSIQDFHNDVKLLIVCPNDIKTKIDEIDLGQKLEIKYNVHTGDTGFCSQVNRGIENCDTEWFTILEVDDEFKPIWLKSMNEYVKIYPDVSVFLPVVKDINAQNEFLSFTNESVWAYGFSERQGFLDNEVLLEFQNYQTSGGLFKTEVIKENGNFKENIKLTFSYELLLRLTHNGVKIMTVPKVGYQHVTLREDSLFWSYKNAEGQTLSEKEAKFWLDTAKKEFFFKNKRDVNYTEA
jgi:GT2 family glycosyltransferase